MAVKKRKVEEQESVGRRATRTFFASVAGKFAAMLITTATFILVARLLGPSSYGIFTIAIGYASFVGAVGIFGIAAYFDRNISYMSYKKDIAGMARVIANGYSIVVPIAIILTLIGIGLSGYIANQILVNSGIGSLSLVLVSLDILFSTIWGASYSALVGFGKGKAASFTIVVLGLVQLVLGIGLIYLGYGVNGAITGVLVGDAIGFLMTSYYVYSSLREFGEVRIAIPGAGEIKKTLKFALPLATNNLLQTGIANFATLFLSLFASDFILGNYGIAFKGVGIINVVYGTLAIVLIQSFSTFISLKKTKEELARHFNSTLTYSLLLNLPIIVFVGVFAQPLVHLFFGSSFSLAPLYLTLVALALALGITNSFAASFFIAAGKTGELMRISVISVIVDIVMLVLLVPTYTAVGTIVALFMIGIFVNVALYA
ncbi:MAG TPA: oligosaccharide flippase family protein, partial [Candidatus Aquilonibacter sp.]|nr:oligosaccharide flippase family protein [Candidatus Aquilonibacter sp.]